MNAKSLKSLGYLAALLVLAVLAQRFGGDGAGRRADAPPTATAEAGFDFYVLSLSWSPSYCEIEGSDADRDQCGGGRPYAFVVHGLWPQHERGYPRDCPADPAVAPEPALVRSMLDIMPAPGLVRHEWRAHGTCSGLSPEAFFDKTRQARERIVVPVAYERLNNWTTVEPGDVERAFLAANPGLGADMIAPVCGKRFLAEIRICMTKALGFRACAEIDRDACRLDKAVMPPVRGG